MSDKRCPVADRYIVAAAGYTAPFLSGMGAHLRCAGRYSVAKDGAVAAQ